MAGGWTRDGAVQDQIDDTVKDAILRARAETPRGEDRVLHRVVDLILHRAVARPAACHLAVLSLRTTWEIRRRFPACADPVPRRAR